MDIYDYLKLDHEYVAQLFKQFDNVDLMDRQQQIVVLLEQELMIHLRSEQETFYKALSNFEATKDSVVHSEKEHQEIEELIHFIIDKKELDASWIKKVHELHRIVAHHVKEEEHVVFNKAKKVLSQDDAEYLKEKMHYFKANLLLNFDKEKAEARFST